MSRVSLISAAKIIPIISLHKRFHLKKAQLGEDEELLSGFIIIDIDGMKLGVIIDRVERVVSIEVQNIQPPPQMLTGIGAEYIQGVVNRENGYLIILDIRKLFSAKELRKIERDPPLAGPIHRMSIPVFRSYIRRKDMDTVLNCLVTDSVGAGEYLDRFQKSAREALGFDFGFALRGPGLALGVALDSLALTEGDPRRSTPPSRRPIMPRFWLPAASCRYSWMPWPMERRAISPRSRSWNPGPRPSSSTTLWASCPIPRPWPRWDCPSSKTCPALSEPIGARSGRGPSVRLSILGLEHDSIVTAGGGGLVLAFGRREGTVLRNIAETIVPELRMTDYNAALGLAQLRDMEAAIVRRRELAGLFAQSIARTRHHLLSQSGEGEPGYWALPVAVVSGVKDVQAYAKKKEVGSELAFEGSLMGRGFVPESSCPNARSMALRCLLFPLHQRIGASSAQKIVKVLATLP